MIENFTKEVAPFIEKARELKELKEALENYAEGQPEEIAFGYKTPSGTYKDISLSTKATEIVLASILAGLDSDVYTNTKKLEEKIQDLTKKLLMEEV